METYWYMQDAAGWHIYPDATRRVGTAQAVCGYEGTWMPLMMSGPPKPAIRVCQACREQAPDQVKRRLRDEMTWRW